MTSQELLQWAIKRQLPGSCGNTANEFQRLGADEEIMRGDEKVLRKALKEEDNIICRVDLGDNHSFLVEKVSGQMHLLQSFIGSKSLDIKATASSTVMKMVKGSTDLGVPCKVTVFRKTSSGTVAERLKALLQERKGVWGM
jgi:hypothetical protein